MNTETTHPPTNTPNSTPQVQPPFSLVRHFKEELASETEDCLEKKVSSLLTPEVTYIGVRMLRPSRGGGGSTALSRIWINVYARTGTPFLYITRNMLFPVFPDGTLGEGEVVR
ncbi:MAG: hypothetical protein EXS51_02025 [Candidatus Taylorbacteria bacterium]|nr:hypothetical protein [Candidatus Taylorbacteria bacterium]